MNTILGLGLQTPELHRRRGVSMERSRKLEEKNEHDKVKRVTYEVGKSIMLLDRPLIISLLEGLNVLGNQYLPYPLPGNLRLAVDPFPGNLKRNGEVIVVGRSGWISPTLSTGIGGGTLGVVGPL